LVFKVERIINYKIVPGKILLHVETHRVTYRQNGDDVYVCNVITIVA